MTVVFLSFIKCSIHIDDSIKYNFQFTLRFISAGFLRIKTVEFRLKFLKRVFFRKILYLNFFDTRLVKKLFCKKF
jgi:hypothetical protein